MESIELRALEKKKFKEKRNLYSKKNIIVVIKGAGEMASAIACRLHKTSFVVIMTEIEKPSVIRRAVSFAQSVFDGDSQVEDIIGECIQLDEKNYHSTLNEVWNIVSKGRIPVIIDPFAKITNIVQADIVVDAIIAKKNINTKINEAKIVIGIGPGFVAKENCHYAIETMRGHNLGIILEEGSTQPDTGIPGNIAGVTMQRVLRSPTDGILIASKQIGDKITKGDIVATVSNQPVISEISGVLRGILFSGLFCNSGQKIGDIDPRDEVSHCFTISDKARAIAGSVLEAILRNFILLKE